jgi:hypothetical protein
MILTAAGFGKQTPFGGDELGHWPIIWSAVGREAHSAGHPANALGHGDPFKQRRFLPALHHVSLSQVRQAVHALGAAVGAPRLVIPVSQPPVSMAVLEELAL